MRLIKTNPLYTFAMIANSRDQKAAFKADAGIKGRRWYSSEDERDAEIARLLPLAERHGVDLVPEKSDMALA